MEKVKSKKSLKGQSHLEVGEVRGSYILSPGCCRLVSDSPHLFSLVFIGIFIYILSQNQCFP